jgi:hypothetical protein
MAAGHTDVDSCNCHTWKTTKGSVGTVRARTGQLGRLCLEILLDLSLDSLEHLAGLFQS